MGVLTVIGAFLVALIVPAVSRLLSDEYKEWRPHLVRKVIRFPVRFRPSQNVAATRKNSRLTLRIPLAILAN